MTTVRVGNLTISGVTADGERLLKARAAFVTQYCAERGWNQETLEWPQIMEMRQQEGWKNPVGVVINGK